MAGDRERARRLALIRKTTKPGDPAFGGAVIPFTKITQAVVRPDGQRCLTSAKATEMTEFSTYTIETAPESAKPILQSALNGYGFVPNLYANMAEAPSILEGYTTLSIIFGKTNLSETERQIILMTNNRLNGCKYCMAAHTTLSQMGGVPNDVIKALRNNTPLTDPKLETLRQFAIAINEGRGWPTDAQINVFLAAGYTRQTVLEVILGTALKVMSNYTNHVAQTELDDAFTVNAWETAHADAAA